MKAKNQKHLKFTKRTRRQYTRKTSNQRNQNLQNPNGRHDRMASSYLTYPPNLQLHFFPSTQNHTFERQHWASTATAAMPQPSGNLYQSLRNTNSSCQKAT